jgi:phosphoenolpyruvate carboxykinase (ATP)
MYVYGYPLCGTTWCSLLSVVLDHDVEFFNDAGFDLDRLHIRRNASIAQLYEDAVANEGAVIGAEGALIVSPLSTPPGRLLVTNRQSYFISQNFSGKKTGRSPRDRRIVCEETSRDDIWWGSVNIKMDERLYPYAASSFRHSQEPHFTGTFEINRERAIDYLNTKHRVYVFDGFAGVSSLLFFL